MAIHYDLLRGRFVLLLYVYNVHCICRECENGMFKHRLLFIRDIIVVLLNSVYSNLTQGIDLMYNKRC